ncbi:Acyl-phosphate:glycerol-3-phosphate O-acyltransferase PlsY (EC [Olavius algarvensis associated proteobacterium Delta 3]|nr:Acyl-phosphate:glycerol-3-phosphate O-acyltransferase PlsY (EC [Olavius algarvensis associated proteobacterium Delta 3]CAB5162957.1 Acyl-phosphate:glycerol-3-phosphate O-acyltransferase PlsY (EC [Olavius algarvensis associated proteobacterium Delta 3]
MERVALKLPYLLLPVFAYLLGSVPFGLVLTRLFSDVDIRREGSGNIGATNVRRTAGNTLGVMTLAGDVFKGAFPVYLAGAAVDMSSTPGQVFVSIVAIAAIAGHFFPVYLTFRDGGKGVATTTGAFLMISPAAILVALLVFILCVCWFNRVSVASMAAAAALPVCIWETTGSGVLTGTATLVAAAIVIRHKDNLVRLLRGTEPPIW